MVNARIEIYESDLYLEALDVDISYIKTAGDLGSITTVNSSYSWSMKFPKTPNNTQVLDGLGLVGSGSRKPYEKIYCNLTINGYPIAIKALLNIKETNEDNYSLYIQEGFVDFLKDITTDTVGGSLDLSDLNHVRNVATIQNSLSLMLPYAYLVADVNGAYNQNVGGTTNLDSRYMTPYANVNHIWEAIFEHYGWTFSFNDQVQESLEGTWMSYPSEIVVGEDPENTEVIGTLQAENERGRPINGRERQAVPLPVRTLNADYIVPRNTRNIEFVIQENGNYKVEFGSTGIVHLEDQYGNRRTTTYTNQIAVNGAPVRSGGRSDSDTITETQMTLFEGDIIRLQVLVATTEIDTYVEVYEALLRLSYLSQGQVSFTQALIKYKISDFLKEVMTREALTPFVDSENKHIEFLTLNERIGFEQIDFSKYYVNRTREGYLYRDYAQNNYFRHKYDNELDDYNDGNIDIDNKNLAIEKTIYESASYSPSDRLYPFQENGQVYFVPQLKMFEVEIRREDDVLIGEYEFLKDRFFFVKTSPSTRDIYIDDVQIDNPPLVDIVGSTFRDIANTKYESFDRMAQDAKVHTIELAIPLYAIIGLDLRRTVYFNQQASIYILNKLTYKPGEISIGEFLRITPEQRNRAFSNAFSGAFSI